jgi:P-type Cu2+ transporter
MKKIMHVDGMMCTHCEARVRKALEALPSVEKAEPDHNTGCVTVTLSAPCSDEQLTQTVTEAGYTVRGIE